MSSFGIVERVFLGLKDLFERYFQLKPTASICMYNIEIACVLFPHVTSVVRGQVRLIPTETEYHMSLLLAVNCLHLHNSSAINARHSVSPPVVTHKVC